MLLDQKLIMIELEVSTKEEALTQLGNRLSDLGYVKKSFTKSILLREKEFPTALPTHPYGVAIPHTDADQVITSKLAIALLKNTIPFSQMGNNQQEIKVKAIFMLAMENANDHSEILGKLMGVFQDKALLYRLDQMKKHDDIIQLLRF